MDSSFKSLTIEATVLQQIGSRVQLDVYWNKPVDYIWVQFKQRDESKHLFIPTDQHQTVIKPYFQLRASCYYNIHVLGYSIKNPQFAETYAVTVSDHKTVRVDGKLVQERFQLKRCATCMSMETNSKKQVKVKNTSPNSCRYSVCGLNHLPQKEGSSPIYVVLLQQDMMDTSLLLLRNGQQTSVDIPEDLRPAMNFHVIVHACFQVDNHKNKILQLENTSSCQFSFCTVMTKCELRELSDNAKKLTAKSNPRLEIKYFYRNKSVEYWEEVMREGIEKKYIKNSSGDKASVINENEDFKGLFFNTRINKWNMKPPDRCVFGPKRLSIPSYKLLNENTHLYFADFYCHKETGPHKVVLIITVKGSETDHFCDERLLKLDVLNNPFLTLNPNNKSARIPDPCQLHIEVCYTENIPVKTLVDKKIAVFSTLLIETRARDTAKGIPKRQDCPICNLKTVRDLTYSFRKRFEQLTQQFQSVKFN